MSTCKICEHDLVRVMDFGQQPVANHFLTPDEFDGEYRFHMTVGFCPACTMLQLEDLPDREQMFHGDYAFFSSTSRSMAVHFGGFADQVVRRHLQGPEPLVVEIGCNDGIMLQHYARPGIRCLGVEPSGNVAKVAQDRGLEVWVRFMEAETGRDIVTQHGAADAVVGANVICHIPYLHSVVEGIKTLLKPEGVFVFEEPYMGEIVRRTSYDQIYDEHAFYFSLMSLSALFERWDMEIVDAQPQGTHGGSMRYTVGNKGMHPVSGAVVQLLAEERALGLDGVETYHALFARVAESRERLMAALRRLKAEGKRVVGYAATSKSTTVTNYCGITPDLVEYISDTTPIKQGRYSPGAHIPVRPYQAFKDDPPEVALLFAWNHAAEILANEKGYTSAGGRFLVYVPRVGFMDPVTGEVSDD